MKTAIFGDVLGKVSEVMELTPNDVLHSNTEECTDARCILVKVLADIGMTDSEIAKMVGVTRQCVNYSRNHFDERLRKWSVRVGYKECSNISATYPQ